MTNISKIYFNLMLAGFLLISGEAYALTSGPSMPEYTQWEPVEATDMVSLSNGNFSWSLPVMTVPGPGLGFPLVLSYHGGIEQKDEASWVGLGWNLEAGAIARQVNKLPDDYRGVQILEAISSNSIHGWSASLGYNGATVGITWREGEGMDGGFVGYDLLHQLHLPVSLDVTVGTGAASGMTGISGGVSLGEGSGKDNWGLQLGASLSVGISLGQGLYGTAGVGISLSDQPNGHKDISTASSLASMGVSLSQKNGPAVGISTVGARMSNNVQGSVHSSSWDVNLPIPTPVGLFSIGFSPYTEWIEGLDKDYHYGFLYDDSIGMGCAGQAGSYNCSTWNSPDFRRRQEFMSADREVQNGIETKLMRPSEDIYAVAAQGVSGVFKPGRQQDGDYLNTMDNTSKMICGFLDCSRVRINRTEKLEAYRNLLGAKATQFREDVYWRFVDDGGGAEYTDKTDRDGMAVVSKQSRKIKAKYSQDGDFDAPGKLIGFDIFNADGAIYSFDFPLYNVWENKTAYENQEWDLTTTQDMYSPYAYAWLMTSIKSPDYVDMNNDGITQDDIGGWVKFTYGDGNGASGIGKKPLQYWVTPYYDPNDATYQDLGENKHIAFSAPNPQTNATSVYDGYVRISHSRSSGAGLKQIAYLYQVETPTHKAVFATASRADNKPFQQPHPFSLIGRREAWSGRIDGMGWLREFHLNVDSNMVKGIEGTVFKAGDKVDLRVAYTQRTQASGGPECVTSQHAFDINDYVIGSAALNLELFHPGPLCGLPDEVFTDNHFPAPNYITDVVVTPKAYGLVNASKRLVSIKLFDKAHPNAAISSVTFDNTGYQLCPNTPNSDDANHGKLTLNSFTIGQGDGSPSMPPYRFYYGYNPPFQSYPWVAWERGNWDRWGNYCPSCSYSYHEPQIPNASNRNQPAASAWSLNRITMPSGTEMSIKYAPKTFNYVGSDPIGKSLGDGKYEMLIASGGPEVQTGTQPLVAGGQNVEDWGYYSINLSTIRNKLGYRNLTIQSYRYVMTTYDDNGKIVFASSKDDLMPNALGAYSNAALSKSITSCGPGSTLTCSSGGIIQIDQPLTTAQVPGEQLWVGFKYLGNKNRINGDFKLYATVTAGAAGAEQFAQEDYANGVVVTDMDLREPFSNKIQNVHYQYEGGVTPSLPGTFSDYGDSRMQLGRGFEFYLGNPGVTYSKTTTTNNGKNKVSHYFLTSKDIGVYMTGYTGSQLPNGTPDGSDSKFVGMYVNDISSLWGALWKKEEYADGVSAPVLSTYTTWAANFKQMPTVANMDWDNILPRAGTLVEYPKDSQTDEYLISSTSANSAYKNYFGQQQIVASHRFFNSQGCFVGDGDGDACAPSHILTTQIVWKRILPSVFEEQTVKEGLSTNTYSYDYDFLTAAPLKTRTVTPDGQNIVVETKPAYYQYSSMQDKNQLTQSYATTKYTYSSPRDLILAEMPSHATSSELTIWRPYDKQDIMLTSMDTSSLRAFRKYRTYNWRADLTASPSFSTPNDACSMSGSSISCNNASAQLGREWFLNEQVNRYDKFSHAVDVMDSRNVNTTTLYGNQYTVPVAVIQNTPIPANAVDKTLEGFYESFEGNDEYKNKLLEGTPSSTYATNSGNWKTGRTSLEVKNPGMVCFDLGVLLPSLGYEASVWYFDASSGAGTSDPNATRPGIFFGKDGGCESEYHPNGFGSDAGPVAGGGGGRGDGATGSKTWKRISAVMNPGQCNVSSQLTPSIVCLYANKSGIGKNVVYDELRVRPTSSFMTTYTYDDFGRMTSSADTREVVSYFEYDKLGNLTGIRNDDRVLVSEQAKRIGNH